MIDYFIFNKHLCIVFEILDISLYDLIKASGYIGKNIINKLFHLYRC